MGARNRHYAELNEVYDELEVAEKLHRRLGCPVIDISETLADAGGDPGPPRLLGPERERRPHPDQLALREARDRAQRRVDLDDLAVARQREPLALVHEFRSGVVLDDLGAFDALLR